MTAARSVSSTDDVLKQSVSGAGDSRVVTLDPRFQGLPDTAHGGTVLALFDAVAAHAGGARSMAGIYRRRVPLAMPLQLTIDRDAVATRLRLSDAATILVEGTVAAVSPTDIASASGEAGGTGAGGVRATYAGSARTGARSSPASVPPASPDALAPPTEATALPLSRTCFACGTDNTLGLRVRLTIDETTVGGVWTPREEFRVGDALAPVAVTTLLDEAAFWLGAAAAGESGMTTDVRVRLHGPVAFGRVVVAGSRALVRPRADDARYWDTDVAVWDEDGAVVATATITFVAVRGGARKLVAGLLAVNPPDVLRRVFPAYVR